MKGLPSINADVKFWSFCIVCLRRLPIFLQFSCKMEDKNSDQQQNLVEKIPTLDMILTIPSEGSQSSDQMGSTNPCFIMCIDASGRLLRIPMSVLQKQNTTSKIIDNHDKQKAPVATIAPWITSQNSHGNVASQVQQQSAINRHQISAQQLFVDQSRPINQQIHLGQQIQNTQDHTTQKFQLIGSQQQLVDKLQILMQKSPVTSTSTKNMSLINQQSLRFPNEQLSLRPVAANDGQHGNQCPALQPQVFTKQHSSPQVHPISLQPVANFQLGNKNQEVNALSLQRFSFPQPIGQQHTNVPPNLNLFAVLQNNKIFQSKTSLQSLDQFSTQKPITNEQQSSTMSAKEEHQNWSNIQLFQQDRQDMSFTSKQNLTDASTSNNLSNSIVNGKPLLTLNNLNIQFKGFGGKVDMTNKQPQTQCISNEIPSQAGHSHTSQQINVLQSPSKASLLLSSLGASSLKASVSVLPHANGHAQSEFHMQTESCLKDQVHSAQKVDLGSNKVPEHNKSEKQLQSQFVLIENKGSPYLQLQASKYSSFPVAVSSVNVQCSNRSLEPSFVVTPHVQFSTSTLATPQQMSHSSQIIKSTDTLRPIGNVQTIVIPNNISLNTLQIPQINGLPLSNLSSIHIIPSSGMNHDQVLLLSSHSSPQVHPALVPACTQSCARQFCSQALSVGKQTQNPVVVVQSSVARASVNQEYLRQLKNVGQTNQPSSVLKPQSTPGLVSGALPTDINPNNVKQRHSSGQQMPNNCNQFVVGQEYQLSYPNGLRVVAVWDGKYFKVKTPSNASVTPLKTQPPSPDKTDIDQHQPSQTEKNIIAPIMKHQDADQAQMGGGHSIICKKCGKMCLNCEECEACGQSSIDGIPNKKPKLTSDINVVTQLNNQQLSLSKLPSGKRPKKIVSKKINSASPKKDAEIVHILSSDDEQSHSSSLDDSNKTPSSPASSSAPYQSSSSSIPFSGFRVNIRKIFFGKISCDWMNTLTFDGKSVNLLSDSCSVSYSLSACGSEVILVAAYFDANKHCTYLFLQVNHSSALKLFDRIFTNSRSLYDPLSKDDCAKYVVLFLDDSQTNLMEVIPRVVESMQLCNGTPHPIYKTIENFDVDAFLKSVRLSGDPILQKKSVIINRKCEEEDGDETHQLDHSLGPTNGKIINLFTYPPSPATGGITVTNEDLFCLNEGEFLNDVIIDFYLKYLSSDLLIEQFRNSHIFSSFFYRRLTRKVQKKNDEEGFSNMSLQQKRHSHVKTWTRHVDLFSKDFIVVPINESAHWFLAIICYPGLTTTEYENRPEEGPSLETEKPSRAKGKRVKMPLIKNVITKKLPCILVFDSLSGPSRSSVIKLIRDYLQVEWDLKKKNELGERHFNKDTLKGAAPECPQQTNFSDCGIYILQYVESFFTNPITDYTFPIKQPMNWFDEEKICTKRAELQGLILNMQKIHNPGLDFNPDQNGCIIKNNHTDVHKVP